MRFHKFVFIVLVIALVSSSLSACSTQNQSSDLHMMPMNQMPAEVQSAPVTVQTAYQFAAANS
ncbi:MAG: hypothetical protein ACYC6R_10350, partial [Anaerolineales bacterium]